MTVPRLLMMTDVVCVLSVNLYKITAISFFFFSMYWDDSVWAYVRLACRLVGWYYCVDRHLKNLARVHVETQLVTSDCLTLC